MVGYSRLMESDEAGTIARQRTYRAEIIDPKISKHHGRIFKTMGDGLLAEFASVVDAIACAVEFQRAIAERDADLAGKERIRYRVGINLGDVVIDGDDILGEGVNIAARLEGLAEPGGICISGSAFDQLGQKVAAGYEYLGEQQVKNIRKPVRAYRVLLNPEMAGRVLGKSRPSRSRILTRGLAALAVTVAALAGGFWWWQAQTPDFPPARPENRALPLPEKPSIAVLPFTNMSEDRTQTYFSEGISEDIITDLSKLSGLFVVARNSSFTYKGAPLDVRRAAEELGVRYVLTGSVRRAGQQVRINAQLIDAETGGHLWADRYDGKLDDVFGLQDTITNEIVTILAVKLTSGEQQQVALRQTANAQAYDVFLKGWDQYLRQTPESLGTAITYFEKAVELDPDYSRAYAALAATYWQIHRRYWHAKFNIPTVHEARFKAETFLEKAKRQPTALSHQVAAAMLSLQSRHTEAIAEAGKAIGVDPNDADSYVALAGALSLAGNPEEALQLMQKAMRLNPYFPAYYLYELGLAQFGVENFQAAAATLEKATALNADDRWSYRLLLAAYGQLGRTADAERLAAAVERNWRGFDPVSVSAILFWYPFKEPADRERLATGLRLANVPD